MHNFQDSVTVEPLRNVSYTSEGYLVADAFSVRTGCQVYKGKEVGRPDLPLVTVYRSEEAVFDRASVEGFAHKPITRGHPSVLVDSKNWAQHTVGEVSTEALRDGERLRLRILVKDESSIEAVKDGSLRHLSAGYLADIVWGDGVAPDGTPFQAQQVNIRPNHVALVPRGRAGNCMIGDEDTTWGAVPLSDEELPKQKEVHVTTKTVFLDGGKSVEVTDASAQILLDHVAGLTERLGQVTGELAAAQTKIMTDADFTAAVTKRVNLMDEARKKSPDLDLSKLVTDGDIMRAVVAKTYPTLTLDGQSDDFVRGIYATIPVSATANGVKLGDADPMRVALATMTFDAPSAANVDQAIMDEDKSWQKSVSAINEGF